MKDGKWYSKAEIRKHLGRDEDRASLRDLRQSGFPIARRARGGGLNEWQLTSLDQDLEQLRLRTAITARMEEYIFERDGHKCILCGKGGENARLVVDHRIPIDRLTDRQYVRDSGWSRWFQTLCKPCNDAKRQECGYCKVGPGEYRKHCLHCHLAFPTRHSHISGRVDIQIRDRVLQEAQKRGVSVDTLLEEALAFYFRLDLRKTRM
jgi:hypothetical protein